MNKKWFFIGFIALLISCDYFKQEDLRVPVARVNESYLYEDDIQNLLGENTSSEDSTLIVSSYITRWATQQLLIDQAIINLPEEDQSNYERLIRQYRNDLYTEAYKRSIVAQQLDSTISGEELEQYYNNHRENFRLNDELVQLRFIEVDPDFSNLNQIKEKFRRYSEEARTELANLSIQFKSYSFDDSTWVKKEVLFERIPALQASSSQVLKKSNFTQLQDSIGVYLVQVEDLLERNDVAPLAFVAPTLKEIILNRRKLDLIKKLEKDITKDAIKDKKFETFDRK